jgi:hypothetical protein
MANDLNTILDDAGNRALVEKYIEKKFLERRSYDTVLVGSEWMQKFSIPEKSGQYLEATRKGFFRRPQNVSIASPNADPLSGASMATSKVKFPMEFIHEYVSVGAQAQLTTWVDLEAWIDEDLPLALKRRRHELVQNAFIAGRFQPGVYDANGAASTAFDAVAEATVTIWGLSFTFKKAPGYYSSLKPTFAAMNESDRATFSDLENIRVRILNAGGPRVDGMIACYLSDAMATDLANDDKYFLAMVNAFKGEGLKKGVLGDYKGLRFMIDDQVFAETWGAENVRATTGPIHSALITAKGAVANLDLGGKNTPKPKFKIQDITKTGGEKTIGYTVPNQAGVVTPEWCAVYKAPVSVSESNG